MPTDLSEAKYCKLCGVGDWLALEEHDRLAGHPFEPVTLEELYAEMKKRPPIARRALLDHTDYDDASD